MSKKTSLKANFIYNSLYQLLLLITPLITSPYVSRVLGSTGIGQNSYTYAIANTFALVGMLGITNYGNRTIASVQDSLEKRSNIFWNIFTIQISVSIFVFLIYLLSCFFIFDSQLKLLFFIQSFTVLCSLVDINWFFFGIEKFKVTVTRNVIIKILNIVLIFLLVKKSSDVYLYTWITAFSLFLSNLVLFPFLKGEVIFVKPTWAEIRPMIKPILVLFIPVIAITLYKKMDKIMLGSMSSMSQLGFYENTEKIINIPNSLITALGTVMLPRMSFLYANGKTENASSYLNYSMEFVCFMSSALVFGISGIAMNFAPCFFGSDFNEVGVLIIAISPTIFFVSWANVIRTQFLIPLSHDSIYVKSVWLGAIVNLIINFILIPKYGALGSVIGTDFAEGSVMLYQTLKVRKQLPITKYVKNGIYYILAGVIMFIPVYIMSIKLEPNWLNIILEILTGALIYLIITAPYVYKKHKDYLLKILKRK